MEKQRLQGKGWPTNWPKLHPMMQKKIIGVILKKGEKTEEIYLGRIIDRSKEIILIESDINDLLYILKHIDETRVHSLSEIEWMYDQIIAYIMVFKQDDNKLILKYAFLAREIVESDSEMCFQSYLTGCKYSVRDDVMVIIVN